MLQLQLLPPLPTTSLFSRLGCKVFEEACGVGKSSLCFNLHEFNCMTTLNRERERMRRERVRDCYVNGANNAE